jgi:excinuclease UvrABC nuclease subunit
VRHGWAIDARPWKQLEELIAQKEWRKASLDPAHVNSVPAAAGVYQICAGLQDVPVNGRVMSQLYNVVYVGQAKNLRRRFREHVSGHGDVVPAKKTFRALDFWYTTAPLETITELEQRLIDAFGPPANKKNAKVRFGDPIPAGKIRKRF